MVGIASGGDIIISPTKMHWRISGSSLLAAMDQYSQVPSTDALSVQSGDLTVKKDGSFDRENQENAMDFSLQNDEKIDRGGKVHASVDLAEVIRRWTHALQRIHKQALQLLNLRHIISNEMLIYPGYVPEHGVNYRVFHYGLEFRVGNWSFDKAKWRNIDLVNKCWANFPNPPNPSSLDSSNVNILQRDLLSIECAKKLNEALTLHHERRKCSLSSEETDNESATSRKFRKVDPKNETQESSVTTTGNQTFISFRFWIVYLWVITIMYMIISRRKGLKKRGKTYKSKRRTSHSVFLDTNGHNEHLRNAEIS